MKLTHEKLLIQIEKHQIPVTIVSLAKYFQTTYYDVLTVASELKKWDAVKIVQHTDPLLSTIEATNNSKPFRLLLGQ